MLAFSEGTTERGSFQYYVQIPRLIANVPEVGKAYKTEFDFGFYDNGAPQHEGVVYCTNAAREEVLGKINSYLEKNKPVKPDYEVETNFNENDPWCGTSGSLVSVSKLQWY